jgi:hypothetical protein
VKYTGQSAKFGGYLRKPGKMWQDLGRIYGIFTYALKIKVQDLKSLDIRG